MNPTNPDNLPMRVLARPADADASSTPGLVRLSWSMPAAFAGLVQVYIDAELYDVSADPADRAMWLLLDLAVAHRIDLVVVSDDASAWVDHSPSLLAAAGIARPVVVGDLSLAVGTRLRVDHADGRAWSRPAYRGGDDRSGFGALFGGGGFGYDLSIGTGLGRGPVGLGPLGAGAQPIAIRSAWLGPGEHALTLRYEPADAAPGAVHELTIHNPESPPPATPRLLPGDTLGWS